MQRSWVDSYFYIVSEWVMRLAFINLLWILFTMIGLFVFGFMPATIAMFALVRKMLLKEGDFPIFKTFFSVVKKEFLRANVVGLVFLLFGYMLIINFQFLGLLTGWMHMLFSFFLILIGILFIAVALLFIPLYVHVDLKAIQYYQLSLMIAFVNPHIIIFMVAGLVGVYYLFNLIPGLTLFFFGSVIASFIMWSAMLAYKRIQLKKEKINGRMEQSTV
ncbi:YesL family protein [Alkalihalobacillus pseudalcaliphilus]|uniref:YesL family protein n=1 Tax=Alkalihalobacillus pseudalcaliphilus TaxID=79884 RepID=UPI00064D92A4|nr:DUF624 domain-containing protein [Alkalihalobacillus pseudalcaliphilus]KMK75218.1 hypothetical protein AB990_17455 [Alkalihalobacillus pseudalcaliphilus]